MVLLSKLGYKFLFSDQSTLHTDAELWIFVANCGQIQGEFIISVFKTLNFWIFTFDVYACLDSNYWNFFFQHLMVHRPIYGCYGKTFPPPSPYTHPTYRGYSEPPPPQPYGTFLYSFIWFAFNLLILYPLLKPKIRIV